MKVLKVSVLAGLGLALWLGAATGADMRSSPPPAVAPEAATPDVAGDTIAEYVQKRAELHTLRAIFDLVSPDDIPALIADDVTDTQGDGVSDAESDRLSHDLIAEGSYFLVSMSYLVQAGFPNWPHDKPEATYRTDALAKLDTLRTELIDTVLRGDDPLPILEQAAEIFWLTEGSTTPIDGRADFAGTTALVTDALSEKPPERVSL